MKVTIHKLFEYLLETAGEEPPECVLGFSLSQSPTLGDFLPDLSPDLVLDWNGVSFQGLPALRDRVIAGYLKLKHNKETMPVEEDVELDPPSEELTLEQVGEAPVGWSST